MILNSKQMYLAESLACDAGVSYKQLMENAGNECFDVLIKRIAEHKNKISKQNCMILCGNGNNGGDGFVLARLMAVAGFNVTVILCDGPIKTKNAAENFNLLTHKNIQRLDYKKDINVFNVLKTANIIIDAIYGIGFHGELPMPIKTIINICNEIKAYKMAIDIPTGMECNTGKCNSQTFKADVTITFLCKKYAHTIKENQVYLGEVIVADIGITEDILKKALLYPDIIDKEHIENFLPVRKKDSHKGNYGKLLNISGSVGFSGAALMSTLAAIRSGAGIVTLLSDKAVINQIASAIMEATTISIIEEINIKREEETIAVLKNILDKYDVVLIGCGLGNNNTNKNIVEFILKNYDKKIILDADGINLINNNIDILKETKANVILTPHPGEMSRLINKPIDYIEINRINTAIDFANEYNQTIVLKGTKTIVACENKNVYINESGNAGLAKGGSGDVLAGIIAGFATMGLSLEKSAVCAVYLHGITAELLAQKMSTHSIAARDVIEYLPFALKSFNK